MGKLNLRTCVVLMILFIIVHLCSGNILNSNQNLVIHKRAVESTNVSDSGSVLGSSNVTSLKPEIKVLESGKNKSGETADSKNSSSVKNVTSEISTPVNDQNKTFNSFLNEMSTNFPQIIQDLNATLKSIGVDDTTDFLKNLNLSSTTLRDLYNRTNLQRDLDRTKDLAGSEISKAVLKHQAETAVKDIDRKLANSSLSGLANKSKSLIGRNWNFTKDVSKINLTTWIDPNFNPNLWLFKLNAPWRHITGNKTENETQVIQVCKFDNLVATCSAEYSSWNAKLWFQFAEAPKRNGINMTVYERGHIPRVRFSNRVNGTDCQRFKNGSFHQICVKTYGYDKDLGPTRVCIELGAAIFNHGVASTDFGCFRFGSAVRHESPMENESPDPVILNSYILANNYSNIFAQQNTSGTDRIKTKAVWSILTALTIMLFFK